MRRFLRILTEMHRLFPSTVYHNANSEYGGSVLARNDINFSCAHVFDSEFSTTWLKRNFILPIVTLMIFKFYLILLCKIFDWIFSKAECILTHSSFAAICLRRVQCSRPALAFMLLHCPACLIGLQNLSPQWSRASEYCVRRSNILNLLPTSYLFSLRSWSIISVGLLQFLPYFHILSYRSRAACWPIEEALCFSSVLSKTVFSLILHGKITVSC